MSKSNKPDSVAEKLRDSLSMEDNKPDTVGSPITPLETRPSGLTSTSSCSSSSSESVSGHTPATRKPDSVQPITSAAQSSKSTVPSSAAQSSKSAAQIKTKSGNADPSAAKSSSSAAAVQSKSSSSSAAQYGSSSSSAGAQTGSSSPAGAKPGSSSPKKATASQRPGRGSATSDSASGTAKASSGKSTSTPPQQQVKLAPCGNLFPSGKVQITGMTQGNPKSVVMDPVPKSYGYGSVVRGSILSTTKPTSSSSSSSVTSGSSDVGSEAAMWKKAMTSSNPEEVKRVGNEMFKKSCFSEALKLYDRALELSPRNAACHSNRAATLSCLGRVGEAVIEAENAVKLDPKFARAHHRLATLLLRLGQVDNAGKHFFAVEEGPDPKIIKMLQLVDKHLNKCTDARKRGEWQIVLNEVCAAMENGADVSPQLGMCKVEALLKLLRLDDAQTVVAFVPKVEPFPASFSQTRFFDMNGQAYTSFVKSQMELALGRFENAVTAAEKASEIDPTNSEVEALYRNVKLIARARDRGDNLYESERYTEATAAYTEGLKYDPSNAALFYHRADCFFKIGMWEKSIEDCNQALLTLPSYIKALRQRAASYTMLEKWVEAVKDYEILRRELAYDIEIAESLFHAQVELKKSLGEVVLNMEFGGVVEEISSLEELKAALTRPGVSILLFMRDYDHQSKEMSGFMDALCVRYPSLHFLKVEIEKCAAVGAAEKVRVVPTFKIYKNGTRLKEIVCPSKEALETSVRHFSI